VSGFPVANRREARKLGLLPSGKSSEAERERLEPLERNERVCGEESDIDAHSMVEDPGQGNSLQSVYRKVFLNLPPIVLFVL
jgi:hypothetical protein